MYLRYFAHTDSGPHSDVGLAYMRSLVRIAPVRVVTLDGVLSGAWATYNDLLTTPMVGDFINIVCLDPSRWVWQVAMEVPTSTTGSSMPSNRDQGLSESLRGTRELYTDGVRNVLLAPCPPRLPPQTGTALRYEALVVPTEHDAARWTQLGGAPRVITTPVIDHRALRAAVLG